MRARWFHRLRARLFGYFWTPCPLCGRKFGGHEWGKGGSQPAALQHPDGTLRGIAICPDCQRAGRGTKVWTPKL